MYTMDVAFAKQYSSLLYMLAQQKGSRFSTCVRNETVAKAEQAYFNTIGAADEPEQKAGTHVATPLSEPNIGRRRVIPVMWHMGTPLDKDDLDRMTVEPTNWVVQSQNASLGRKIDDIIIDAALELAYIGKEGSTSVYLYQESTGISGTAAAAAITEVGTLPAVGTIAPMDLGKMLAMMTLFNKDDVDPDITKYWAVSPDDIAEMLDITEVGSSDYNTVKALAQGKMETYMGFKFIWTNRLKKDAATSTGWRTFAWAQDGIVLAKIGDISTRIDERADLSYLTQVYSKMDLGAVRMEGAKVHECITKVE